MKRLISLGIGALGTLGAALTWYAWRVETRWIDVRHITLPIPNLPPAFEGYRIAHVADLHLSAEFMRTQLPRIIRAINRENVDLIVNTGDYVTGDSDTRRSIFAPLAELRAPDGVWSSLGNHDLCLGADLVSEALENHGIGVLRNQHHVVQRGTDRLILAGIDDAVWGEPDLSAALAGVNGHDPVILLVHEPDFAQVAAADTRIVLQLSGHAHGGQICLPGFKRYLPRMCELYQAGRYQVEHMQLYVSRGLGVTMLHMRFRCRPELPIITLTRASFGQNGNNPHD